MNIIHSNSINIMENNENNKDQKKTNSREGNLNPMWNHKHSYISKQKMMS